MRKTKQKYHLSPARLIALGFAGVILIGTLILMLPFASKGQSASFIDALFTSTSATCVTGLIVRDTYTGWTTFGQIVIICLIQLGGLGLMTMVTLVSYMLGKHLDLYNRKVLMQSAGNMSLSGIGSLIRKIIPFSFAFEGLGMLLLMIRMIPRFGFLKGLWFSFFISISAFCNAGFDLMGAEAPFSSMTAFVHDPLVTVTLTLLILIGGLGFIVWRDLAANKFHWKKYQMHTKLVLVTSAVLVFGGWILFAIFEWNASLRDMNVGQKILASLFLSVAPRTAGFNTVDLTQLSESGNLLTDFFMLIGGCPGSTAGGIKTTTIAVLVLSAVASSQGRTRVKAFKFAIDRDTIRQASSIVMIYIAMAMTAIMLLCMMEPVSLKAAMFEVVSAIATVGLTLGITPSLSVGGKILILILMYAGRLGGMSFIMLFAERKSEAPIDRPNGKLLIG